MGEDSRSKNIFLLYSKAQCMKEELGGEGENNPVRRHKMHMKPDGGREAINIKKYEREDKWDGAERRRENG